MCDVRRTVQEAATPRNAPILPAGRKFALIKHQRCAHAKQFKRANRSLKKLKTYLGRVIRDIRRKTAECVLAQDRRQRGRKIYSLYAPEVECIGKGKAHRPYEFGVKMSVATLLRHSSGGQFVAHVAALPGNLYDGHTLITIIPAMQAILRNTLDRVIADAGYRGHNAAPEYRFKVYTAGQRRRISPQIKRDMKRARPLSPLSVTSGTATV